MEDNVDRFIDADHPEAVNNGVSNQGQPGSHNSNGDPGTRDKQNGFAQTMSEIDSSFSQNGNYSSDVGLHGVNIREVASDNGYLDLKDSVIRSRNKQVPNTENNGLIHVKRSKTVDSVNQGHQVHQPRKNYIGYEFGMKSSVYDSRSRSVDRFKYGISTGDYQAGDYINKYDKLHHTNDNQRSNDYGSTTKRRQRSSSSSRVNSSQNSNVLSTQTAEHRPASSYSVELNGKEWDTDMGRGGLVRRPSRRRYRPRQIYDSTYMTTDGDTMSDIGTSDPGTTSPTRAAYPVRFLSSLSTDKERNAYKDIGWKCFLEKFETQSRNNNVNRRPNRRDKLLSTCEDTRKLRSVSVDRGMSKYQDVNSHEEPMRICSEELDCCPHHGRCERQDCNKMVTMYVILVFHLLSCSGQAAIELFV